MQRRSFQPADPKPSSGSCAPTLQAQGLLARAGYPPISLSRDRSLCRGLTRPADEPPKGAGARDFPLTPRGKDTRCLLSQRAAALFYPGSSRVIPWVPGAQLRPGHPETRAIPQDNQPETSKHASQPAHGQLHTPLSNRWWKSMRPMLLSYQCFPSIPLVLTAPYLLKAQMAADPTGGLAAVLAV